MIHRLDDQTIDRLLQRNEIYNHPRTGMNITFDGDIDMVVVTMTIDSRTFTKDLGIFFKAEIHMSQAMRRTKMRINRQISFHSISLVFSPEVFIFN